MDGVKTVGMTTNGIVLEKKLPDLKAAGLNALNISLDTLQPHRFETFTRRAGIKRVLSAIDKAVDMGYRPLKARPSLWRLRHCEQGTASR